MSCKIKKKKKTSMYSIFYCVQAGLFWRLRWPAGVGGGVGVCVCVYVGGGGGGGVDLRFLMKTKKQNQ